MTASLKL